jgi:hypothetical protein
MSRQVFFQDLSTIKQSFFAGLNFEKVFMSRPTQEFNQGKGKCPSSNQVRYKGHL